MKLGNCVSISRIIFPQVQAIVFPILARMLETLSRIYSAHGSGRRRGSRHIGEATTMMEGDVLEAGLPVALNR
jgi:hypothetical protein